MALTDLGPPRPTHRPADPPVTVRMRGDHVVIRTDTQLDRDATNALAETINGAIAAGCVAVLDLRGNGSPLTSRRGLADVVDPALACSRSSQSITAVGSGVVRVPTIGQPWLIDVRSGRVCTGHGATDWRCVPANAWVAVASVMIAPRAIAATTAPDPHDTPSDKRSPVDPGGWDA